MKQQFIEVDEHFTRDDTAFEEYKKRVSRLFDEKQNHLLQHDAEVKLIHNTLQANKEDREELHRNADYQADKLETYNAAMDKKLNEKTARLLDKQNYAEKEINQSIQLLSKELEKLKYELSDVIDSKFEHITRNVDQETRALRSTYDELSTSLEKTNEELNASFKGKVHTIKSMCATFFAKVETQVGENVQKVDQI